MVKFVFFNVYVQVPIFTSILSSPHKIVFNIASRNCNNFFRKSKLHKCPENKMLIGILIHALGVYFVFLKHVSPLWLHRPSVTIAAPLLRKPPLAWVDRTGCSCIPSFFSCFLLCSTTYSYSTCTIECWYIFIKKI